VPATENLSRVIAVHVKRLRLAGGLSLDQLARSSGVSRSMISSIERGTSNATAVVLDRIAIALGVALNELLSGNSTDVDPKLLLAKGEQIIWTDPATGYQRRLLSPPQTYSTLRLVEVIFPAKARIIYESGGKAGASPTKVYQQIWLLAGKMEITHGSDLFQLSAGDCLAFRIDQPIGFFNPTEKDARYLVAQA
jgi:transcriptional regulator with XRE-family HTH domain